MVGNRPGGLDGEVEPGPAPAEPFWHAALRYGSDGEYVDTLGAFVETGLAAGEAVMVAVPGPRLPLLRGRLDAAAVTLVDMAVAGRNPARIIPGVLHAFLARHPDRPVRIVGEPIWAGRGEREYPRCVQHEALTNLAFAGQRARILCAYDTTRLGAAVIADAVRTHPVLLEGSTVRPSPGYLAPRAVARWFDRPLPEPVVPVDSLRFTVSELAEVRAVAAAAGTAVGLDPDRADDLRIAVTELATNALTQSKRHALLRTWIEPDAVVCEVAGDGVLADPLAGRIPPPPGSERGRGLYLVHQLCDLVEIHTTGRSTTVRVLMDRPGPTSVRQEAVPRQAAPATTAPRQMASPTGQPLWPEGDLTTAG